MHVFKRTRKGLALTFAVAGALSVQCALAETQKVPTTPPKAAVHLAKPAKPAAQSAKTPKETSGKPAKPPASKAKTAHVAAKPLHGAAAAHVPLPQQRPQASAAVPAFEGSAATRSAVGKIQASIRVPPAAPSTPFAMAPSGVTPAADVAAVKRVIEASRKGKEADADAAERSIGDPVARKLAEWVILRSDNTNPSFARYAAFANANPTWPHAALFRRRAENALWNDNVDNNTVLAFFANQKPATAKGRYMLARVLLARGDRAGAAALVRHAWRYEDSGAEVEKRVLEMFGDLLTRADHKTRMDQRFYADDIEGGMRAANRLGGDEVSIARARAAVMKRLNNAKALLDAVPLSARKDPGYVFSRVQWLRKNDKLEEAGKLMLTVPQDPEALVDVDQWWQERRILVRKLLDDHDPHTAYLVARDAAEPVRAYFRADHHFTAGWIALRFLHDPKTAAAHFANIVKDTVSPYAFSRGGYWQGRAAEAMGQRAQARSYYEMAARYTATYYGQLARARIGLPDLGLRGPPVSAAERAAASNLEIVRAAEILYALDERDLLASIYATLGETATDLAGICALAELAGKHHDGRAMLLLGEPAYGRGLPMEYYAYPTVGLPDYSPIAPPLDPAVTYSIARQESHFSQKVVSAAHAMGLMQVTPEAAQDTAKRFKAVYNRARLLSDPVYNMQMGTAELSNLLMGYNGSYILTFAGYNAGRGRVRQWIAAYGDPRDPRVDPVDWVERIPLSETRNYVARIMENLQVYRARFSGGSKLMIEADIKRGAAAN